MEKAAVLFQNGTFTETLQAIVDEVKPEAAYFTEIQGERAGLFIVNVDRMSQIPKIVAPFLLAFDSNVEFQPLMTLEDLQSTNADPEVSFGYVG